MSERSTRPPAFGSVPKTYNNSGLRKDLKSKRAPSSEDMNTIDPFQCGGLNDDDIISVRPPFPRTNNAAVSSACGTRAFRADLQRDYSRKNKVRTLLWALIS